MCSPSRRIAGPWSPVHCTMPASPTSTPVIRFAGSPKRPENPGIRLQPAEVGHVGGSQRMGAGRGLYDEAAVGVEAGRLAGDGRAVGEFDADRPTEGG